MMKLIDYNRLSAIGVQQSEYASQGEASRIHWGKKPALWGWSSG